VPVYPPATFPPATALKYRTARPVTSV
jgi:hypothetical protein